MARIYDTASWEETRKRVLVLQDKCALAWLGGCAGPLHVHHVNGREDEDSLTALCEKHHPTAERLRRWTSSRRRCPHRHPTREGRVACERRLNRTA